MLFINKIINKMIITNLFLKRLKLILILAILVYSISIILVYVEARTKNRQKRKNESLQEGFGYYGEEESQGCFSSDGKCTTQGYETFVQYCKPHPTTGKGCIDENGNQTYATIIKKKPCKVQCTTSKMTVEDGIRLSDSSISYIGTSITHGVESLGCDKIVERFGIDVTDHFLGTFDPIVYKYPLKTCIPQDKDSKFKGYYQQVSTCLQNDSKGSNNCSVMCGRDKNILTLNGFANAKLNKKLINYFPTEVNEEGEVRNVCYDINNIDQIELLNYPGNVPKDFVYPNKCYKHTNVLDFDINLWPTAGTSNIFNLEKRQVSNNVSYIDLLGTQNTNFENNVLGKIISSDYDLNNNQNSYVKVRVGNDTALLEKIYPSYDTGITVGVSGNTDSIENSTYYICFTDISTASNEYNDITLLTLNIGEFPVSSYKTSSGGNVFNSSSYFSDNQKVYDDKYWFSRKVSPTSELVEFYFPCDFGDFFSPINSPSGLPNVFLSVDANGDPITNITNLDLTDTGLTDGDHYFYAISKNPDDNELQHIFSEGTVDIDNNTITFDSTLFDKFSSSLEEFYFYSRETDIPLANSKGTIGFVAALGVQSSSFTIDFSKGFFTGSTFLKDTAPVSSPYNSLEIKDTSILVENDTPYCVFATSKYNVVIGYNFPLYLEKIEDDYELVNFNEFPDVNFYSPSGVSGPNTNYLYRPEYYNDKELVYFNEATLYSNVTCKNNYIKINNQNNYFLSNLESINFGSGYKNNQLYNLYNGIYNKDYGLNRISSGVSSYAVVTNRTGTLAPTSRTIKIIRGNSQIVNNATSVILSISSNQEKINTYFDMIRFQNFVSGSDELLVFEPEKELAIVADFSVFKSPYIENEFGQKTFLCYDDTGRARPAGYVATVPTNGSKIYTNISCPNNQVDYEVKGNLGSSCGVQGIEDPSKPGFLTPCVQDKNNIPNNIFGTSQTCIVNRDTSIYQTINNQFGFGLNLEPIKRSNEMGGKISDKINTYPSYFTRPGVSNRLYAPGEEFYTQKLDNNYFVSLTNDNQTFVDSVENWRRVFTFENNSVVSPYQYFFSAYPSNTVSNKINLNLGKFPDETYNSLKTSTSSDMNLAFSSLTSGVNSQNYLEQGVTYFWGSQRRHLTNNPNYIIGQPTRPINPGITSNPSNNNPSRAYINQDIANFCTGQATKWEYNSCLNTWQVFYQAPEDNVSSLLTGETDILYPDSFIGKLMSSTYRNPYNSFAFNEKTDNPTGKEYPWIGPQPNYASIKMSKYDESASIDNQIEINQDSPIIANFDIIKKDKYVFTSRIYDSNLDIPWNSKINTGDYFNPDFTYFNGFIYSFLLSLQSYKVSVEALDTKNGGRVPVTTFQTPGYGLPGPYFNEELEKYYLARQISGTQSSTQFTKQQISTQSIEISKENGVNVPSIGDYLLIFPTKFGGDPELPTEDLNMYSSVVQPEGSEDSTDGNYRLVNGNPSILPPTYFFGQDSNNNNIFPNYYPTMQIKRIKSIEDNGNTTIINIEDKEYSNSTDFNSNPSLSDSTLFYIFNLGKASNNNNLINRTFQITDIDETTLETKLSSQTISNVDFVEKSSPEFLDNNGFSEIVFGDTAQFSGAVNKKGEYQFKKKYIEFEFEIESISQEDMEKLYNMNLGRKTLFAHPKGTYFGSTTTTQCGSIYENTGDFQDQNVCYLEGCMPADALPDAMCIDVLNNPGHTDLTCPGPKSWRCAQFGTSPQSEQDFSFTTSNFLTPALSARYIKSTTQSAYKESTQGDGYATINSSTNEDMLNTKVMGQCTEMAYNLLDDNYYYLNEFRENSDFYTSQERRTFEIGDTFDYYCSVLDYGNVLSGNKEFEKVINFKVVDIDVNVENTLQEYDVADDIFVLNYDYKCLPTDKGVSALDIWKQMVSNRACLYATRTNTTFAWDKSTNQIENQGSLDKWRVTLPYSVSTYVEEGINDFVIIPRAISEGTRKNGFIGFTDILSGTLHGVSSSSAFLDYYKFSRDKIMKFDGGGEKITDYSNPPRYDYYNMRNSTLSLNIAPSYTTLLSLGGTSFVNTSFNEYSYGIIWAKGRSFPIGDTRKLKENFYNQGGATGQPNAPPLNDCKIFDYIAPDYGKSAEWFNENLSMGAYLSLLASTVYTGSAIRHGIIDNMVLTGTTLREDNGQEAFVNVTVSGKPYGVGYFLSAPESENTMINYGSFGKVEDFEFLSASNFPVNTVLRSNKGFQIKFLPTPPTSFSFENVESPSGEILSYQKNFNYDVSDIVTFKNTNIRNYFRNTSSFTIPYMIKIDVNNPDIPYAMNNEKKWYYPVYKFPGTGRTPLTIGNDNIFVTSELYETKTNNSTFIPYTAKASEIAEILNSFKSITESSYPEDNFSEYNRNVLYNKGEIVKSKLNGEDALFVSLVNQNTSSDLTDENFWEEDKLTKNLSSPASNNFYSRFQENNDFTDFINDTRNLDNQNLPMLITKNLSNTGVSVFCPQPCTLYNLNETYENSFLQNPQYEDIRYIFENPVVLSKEGTSYVVSLGNAPVKKNKNYNVGYLQDGGARTDFLSQYLYLINIKDQEDKYGKSTCTGGLCITTASGFEDTDVNKFEFSNSLLFNFLPCDIDSQDFIKYSVDVGMSNGTSIMVSSLPEYPNSSTPNIFPPYGVSCRVLASSDDGTRFLSVFGHFEYTYNITESDNQVNSYKLIDNSDGTCFVNVTIDSNKRINFRVPTDTSSGNYNYGDICFNTGGEKEPPVGFLIPRLDGGLCPNSFIQLNNTSNYGSGLKLISDNNDSVDSIEQNHKINSFNITSPETNFGTNSGIYTAESDSGTSFNIEFDPKSTGVVLQRNKAIFYTDTNLSGVENIYLPSQGTSVIKAKAVTVFGENFNGKLKHSLDKSNPVYGLDGKVRSNMIFNELKNELLITDSEREKATVFRGTSTVNVENLFETFLLEFNKDTFSLKPNIFKSPIVNPTNKFLYSENNSVNPYLPISAISSESTTTLVSEGMSNIKGTSVNINFEDFLNFNTVYNNTPGGISIPGRSNLQIQLSEIRQNRTDFYINDNNRCNIFFEPLINLEKRPVITSTWGVCYSKGNVTGYDTNSVTGPRFIGSFSDKTKLDITSRDITFYLGCNSNYVFDQSDSSNIHPIVFSRQAFENADDFETETIVFDEDENKKFKITYLVDNKETTFDNYKKQFPTADTSSGSPLRRSIDISFQGNYSLGSDNYDDANIFYGANVSPFVKTGGKIKFEYH
jgi:hypothetical protein